MEYLLPVMVFAGGLAVGAFIARLLRAQRAALDLSSREGVWQAERAGLLERIQAAGVRDTEKSASLERMEARLLETFDALKMESRQRAAAEARAARVEPLEAELTVWRQENAALREKMAELDTRGTEERKSFQDQLQLLEAARTRLSDAFRALSSEALQGNNQSFLHLAGESFGRLQEQARSDLDARRQSVEEMVRPMRESLARVDQQIADMERARLSQQSTLMEQVRSLTEGQGLLREETVRLVNALRRPHIRGRWGEIQLRRVVEMADMLPYCDFVEQQPSEDGRSRPDLLVRLPGGKNVVVDAKTPLDAYLTAMETEDEEKRREFLRAHAGQVRTHMRSLAAKTYWDQFQPAPEFVIMFLPGEAFFSAALENDPALIEEGVRQRIIPASPTTLIALLRAVAYGWRQEVVARGAAEVSRLGQDLHERLRVMLTHVDKVGQNLGRAVEGYNGMVGSLEGRVLPAARKFRELGAASGEELKILVPLDNHPRSLAIPEAASDDKEPE